LTNAIDVRFGGLSNPQKDLICLKWFLEISHEIFCERARRLLIYTYRPNHIRLRPSPRWPVRPRVGRMCAPHKDEDVTRGSIERMRVTGMEPNVDLLSITRGHVDQVGDLHSLWCDLSVLVRSRTRLIGLFYVLQSWRANTSFRTSCINNYWRDTFLVYRGMFTDVLTFKSGRCPEDVAGGIVLGRKRE
jgi:hypothetical protein